MLFRYIYTYLCYMYTTWEFSKYFALKSLDNMSRQVCYFTSPIGALVKIFFKVNSINDHEYCYSSLQTKKKLIEYVYTVNVWLTYICPQFLLADFLFIYSPWSIMCWKSSHLIYFQTKKGLYRVDIFRWFMKLSNTHFHQTTAVVPYVFVLGNPEEFEGVLFMKQSSE